MTSRLRPPHRLVPAVLAAALLLPCLLPAPAAAQMEPRLDRNRDGFMDLQEAQQAALEKFTALDANRDGSLSPPEMGIAPNVENPVDTNGDHRVSFQEYWQFFSGQFTAADTDRDGRLSAQELAGMRQR